MRPIALLRCQWYAQLDFSLRMTVIPISGASALPAASGGKARGLAAIGAAGLSCPPAWCVLPEASAADLEALGAELRRRSLSLLAVRSSASDEDGPGASFAGVHTTELAVPVERLAEAVAAVARSPLAPRARAYREQLGLVPAPGPCAVVVQAMFDAACGGVAFSRGPDEVIVEAVEGLGEPAVDGTVAPETWSVRRTPAGWEATRRASRRQREVLRLTAAGPRREVPSPAPAELLPHAAAREIARGMEALGAVLPGRLDVEWAWREGELVFLQARPLTRPLAEGLPPGETWARANSREILPDLPSALTRTSATRALDEVSHEILARLGLGAGDIPLATYVHGRPVVNERMQGPNAALGFAPEWEGIAMGGSGSVAEALRPPRLGALLRGWRVLWGLAAMVGGSRRRAERHIRKRRRARAARASADPQAESDEALVRRIERGLGQDFADWFRCVLHVYMAAGGALFSALSLLRSKPSPTVLLARLLGREGASTSTRQVEEFVELALAFRAWPDAVAFLSTVGRDATDLAAWRAALPTPLWERVRAWMDRYGHRRAHESEISLPRPAEDPRLLREMLVGLVEAPAPPGGSYARRARREDAAAAAWRQVAETSGPWRYWRIRQAIRKLAGWSALREELRSEMTRDVLLLRRALLELGRRLVSRRRLDAAEDLFDLSAEELVQAAAGTGPDPRVAVARERARRAAWRRIEVPNRFTSEEAAALGEASRSLGGAPELLRGLAVSPGLVEAPACVVRSPEEGGALATGGVLVAHATGPAWTPLFARASAIVVELGGLLSHSATVAREYGIPCVANVADATALLGDGDVLRVDGSRGEVAVLARAPRQG